MARIFGDEVVVTLDDVHINHDTHELVIGGREKDGLEHVATHQGITPDIAAALEAEREKAVMTEGGKEHKEDITKV